MLRPPEDIDHMDVTFPRGAFIIRKICENHKGTEILDVGCGNGTTTKMLGKLGISILGIDVDENEIKRAKDANDYVNIRFSCLNVTKVNDQEFSEILLIEVLEHTDKPLNILKELNRLCDYNGYLILTVPNGRSLKEILMSGVNILKNHSVLFTKSIKWYRKILGRDKIFNESPHIQLFTLKKIRSLIEESGFIIKEEFYCDVWSGLLWTFIPWLPIPFSVKKIERKITKYIPPYFLANWGFLCQKSNEAICESHQSVLMNGR